MEEEKKPFWGPHRLLETLELAKNVLTCTVLSVTLWTTECTASDHSEGQAKLCNYEEINSQVAVVALIAYNQYYYLYQYDDMQFRAKVALELSNFCMSWWVMVVLFSHESRLCVIVARDGIGWQVVAMLGLIYLSYAFVCQLEQMANGVVSISISIMAVVSRKKHEQPQVSQDQLQIMQNMLEELQESRNPEDNENMNEI